MLSKTLQNVYKTSQLYVFKPTRNTFVGHGIVAHSPWLLSQWKVLRSIFFKPCISRTKHAINTEPLHENTNDFSCRFIGLFSASKGLYYNIIMYYILYKDYNTFNNIRTTFYHFMPRLHLSTNQAAILFPLHPFLSIVSAGFWLDKQRQTSKGRRIGYRSCVLK